MQETLMTPAGKSIFTNKMTLNNFAELINTNDLAQLDKNDCPMQQNRPVKFQWSSNPVQQNGPRTGLVQRKRLSAVGRQAGRQAAIVGFILSCRFDIL